MRQVLLQLHSIYEEMETCTDLTYQPKPKSRDQSQKEYVQQLQSPLRGDKITLALPVDSPTPESYFFCDHL
jgi:hypothetical protein